LQEVISTVRRSRIMVLFIACKYFIFQNEAFQVL
jgi:hypothetical protein